MLLSTLKPEQQETLFHLAHSVVVSDGEFSTGVRLLMSDMRREMELPETFEPHYLEAEGMEAIFDTPRSRVVCMISLLRLAYADGAFEIEEQGFLGLLCVRFDISEEGFRRIDHWVRRLIALTEEVKDLY